MTTRWDVERAVKKADLPPTSRLLMLVLLTDVDNDTAVIPPKRTPSLTDLEEYTGRARSTVCVHLNELEKAGWITRTRPDPYLARTEHVRTRYALHVPNEVIHSLGWASPTESDAGPVNGSDLVRSADETGPAPGRIPPLPRSLPPSRARGRAWEEDCLSVIEETLRELVPHRADAHTRDWARRVLAHIPLEGVKARSRYLETVIRNNPDHYLPIRGEPSVAEALAAAIPREDAHAHTER